MSSCDTSSNSANNSDNQTNFEQNDYNEISELINKDSSMLSSTDSFVSGSGFGDSKTNSLLVSVTNGGELNFTKDPIVDLANIEDNSQNVNTEEVSEKPLDIGCSPCLQSTTLTTLTTSSPLFPTDLLSHNETCNINLLPIDEKSLSKPTQARSQNINASGVINAIETTPIITTSVIMTKPSEEIINNCQEYTIKAMAIRSADNFETASLASTSMTKMSINDESFRSLLDCDQSNLTFSEHNVNDSSSMLTPRRVSFPKSDHELVTGYLEPANPWKYVCLVKSISEISEHYVASCHKHQTVPISSVIDHLKSLELNKSVRHPCFSLKNNKLAPQDCEALEEIFKRVQYELVDISSCQLNETSAGALFDMIEYYEAANELDVSDNPNISTRGWDACVLMIRRSRALHTLMAHGNPLSQSNAKSLGTSLNSSSLQIIKLEHCGLRGNPLSYLCSALKRNSTLKELWLAHNDLSNLDAENLAELLKVNAYIEFLDISNNDIKDTGLKYIVLALIHQSTTLLPSINSKKKVAYSGFDDSSSNEDNESLSNLNSDEKELNLVAGSQNTNNKSIKSTTLCGRSMLDTLLTRRKEEQNTIDEQQLKKNENPTNIQPEISAGNVEEEDDIFETSTNSLNSDSLVSNSDNASRMQPQVEEKPFLRLDDNSDPTDNNNPSMINEHENKPNSNCHPTTKALDVNKNSKIDDFDDTQSTDSAFESASEGDISKNIPEDFPRLSSLELSKNEETKENWVTLIENQVNQSDSSSKRIQDKIIVEDDANQLSQNDQTESSNLATSLSFNSTMTAQSIQFCSNSDINLSTDTNIITPPTRNRTHSSDSLSSDNSIDGNSGNESQHFSNKINEKLTKNDTLTRQKQLDVPQETNKKPSGLKAIILWNNNLTKMSGDHISDLLAKTVSIELLNIGKNILSNDFVTTIKEKLSKNTTLTNLGLQSAHLSCPGIKTLASVLQFGGNCTLQRIDIRDNYLQVESLQSIAEALKSNQSVTQIDIDDEPKRISVGNEAQLHYSRMLHNIRSLCSHNENIVSEAIIKANNSNPKPRSNNYYNSRKISLTCQSIPHKSFDSNSKLDVKKKSGTRLRSPVPSPPTVSPTSSPVPSPSRNRFKVVRVMENNNSGCTESSPSPTFSDSPSPQSPSSQQTLYLSPRSRFRVVKINECTSEPVPNTITKVTPIVTVSPTKIIISCENVKTNRIENIDEQKSNQVGNNYWKTSSDVKDSSDLLNDQTITKDNVNQTMPKSLLPENQSIQTSEDSWKPLLFPLGSPTAKEESIEGTIEKPPAQAECKTNTPRTRKTSWVTNASYSATVDRLLSIFHPSQIFNRSSQSDNETLDVEDINQSQTVASNQSLVPVRKTSPPGSLFPWSKLSTATTAISASMSGVLSSADSLQQIEPQSSSENTLNPIETSASFFDVASKQIRGIADFSKQAFRQNITFANDPVIDITTEESKTSVEVLTEKENVEVNDLTYNNPQSANMNSTVISAPSLQKVKENFPSNLVIADENLVSVPISTTTENTPTFLTPDINYDSNFVMKQEPLRIHLNDRLINKFESDESSSNSGPTPVNVKEEHFCTI